MAIYLFDSTGGWIAWKRTEDDRYLWATDGDRLGWFPWDDGVALDNGGEYLGTVVRGSWLLYQDSFGGERDHPGTPGGNRFENVGYPGHPGFHEGCRTPAGYGDVPRDRLRR
ncbi:hypothetical protein CQJ94_09295 [Glycomyces fuscus]|nr:hypothetical protein CQJ94_09295 [Glycomyces fuscus]